MSSLSEQRDSWKKLVASAEWKELSTMMQEQIDSRTAQIMLTPLESADAALGEQFMKGEAAAFSLILRMPDAILEQLETDIEAARKAEEENKGKKDENS